MNMSKVSKCEVTDCAFNRQMKCHALAIQVGDDRPRCDTYTQADQKAGDPRATAGVGACKVDQCIFNRNLQCAAGRIVVGYGSDEADCLTFEPAGAGREHAAPAAGSSRRSPAGRSGQSRQPTRRS